MVSLYNNTSCKHFTEMLLYLYQLNNSHQKRLAMINNNSNGGQERTQQGKLFGAFLALSVMITPTLLSLTGIEANLSLVQVPQMNLSYNAQVNNISGSCSSTASVERPMSRRFYNGCVIGDTQNYLTYRPLPVATELLKDLTGNL